LEEECAPAVNPLTPLASWHENEFNHSA
jgi:hypothetical protein